MALKVGNVQQAKAGTVARTDTAAKTVFTVPAGAMIYRVLAQGAAADSATSSTVTFQARPISSATAATFGTCDVKTAGIETAGRNATLSGIALNRLSEPYVITAAYSETGAASTGGPWTFLVEYL